MREMAVKVKPVSIAGRSAGHIVCGFSWFVP
jgi:hypothetical protein